jgi:hypothetical protein
MTSLNVLTHLCGSEHGRSEVDGSARLEVELELGLALPVAVRLRDNLALDVVCTKDRLLQFNLSQCLIKIEVTLEVALT